MQGKSVAKKQSVKNDQIAKSMSLVPKFHEKEVVNFLLYEKVNEFMEWPKQTWSLFCCFCFCFLSLFLLFQSVLVVKAKHGFVLCSDYDLDREMRACWYVKRTEIHKPWLNMGLKITWSLPEKRYLFDRWLSSMRVDDFQNLIDKMAIAEDFQKVCYC